MSTAVLEREGKSTAKIKPQFEKVKIEINPELKKQAESVLKQFDLSFNDVINSLLHFVIEHKKLPDVLERPCIPSLDDMTEEEFDALMQRAFDQIEAGQCYTPEEIEKEIQARYEASL